MGGQRKSGSGSEACFEKLVCIKYGQIDKKRLYLNRHFIEVSFTEIRPV
jgi:hypothetical protein